MPRSRQSRWNRTLQKGNMALNTALLGSDNVRARLQTLASSSSANSLAAGLRRKRFGLFLDLILTLGRSPLTILDVGGREEFWEVVGFTDTPHRIILLNLFAPPVRHPNFTSMVGDARRLEGFEDRSVDVVFSNSVIEHLGTYADQQRMAAEVRRVGKTYFVQTPSYFFPIEPHFLCPFFHWLPFEARLQLIRRFSLGNITRKPSRELAMQTLSEFRLLRRAEMRTLFPDAAIHAERLLGLTKSYVAVKQGSLAAHSGDHRPASSGRLLAERG